MKTTTTLFITLLITSIISSISFSSVSFAKDCEYVVNKNDVQVNWTAFKTPSKVGVGGQFRDLGISDTLKGKGLKELFNTTKFNIDSASTYTRNSGRDAKIVKYFFQPMMGGLDITGGFEYVNESTLDLRIKMNGVEQKVPLKITDKDSTITAKGIIDVYDFSLKKSLMGINKACFDLHQGKTWNDVEIGFTLKYEKKCK